MATLRLYQLAVLLTLAVGIGVVAGALAFADSSTSTTRETSAQFVRKVAAYAAEYEGMTVVKASAYAKPRGYHASIYLADSDLEGVDSADPNKVARVVALVVPPLQNDHRISTWDVCFLPASAGSDFVESVARVEGDRRALDRALLAADHGGEALAAEAAKAGEAGRLTVLFGRSAGAEMAGNYGAEGR